MTRPRFGTRVRIKKSTERSSSLAGKPILQIRGANRPHLEFDEMIESSFPSTREGIYPHVKRLLDILAAGSLLLIFFPIIVIAAASVRIDSPGPIFFRQRRVGKGGRIFWIIKLRTMIDGADKLGAQVTSADDNRITRLGRFLRASKLDEFPQLINVLKGEMSLVGPRPQVERYVAAFPPDQRQRILSVPPGITGPTAIIFRHEEAMLYGRENREQYYFDVLLPIKCHLDCDYVEEQSAWYDTQIMVKTLALFLRGVGHRMLRRPMGRRIDMPLPESIQEKFSLESTRDLMVHSPNKVPVAVAMAIE